jgi:hypothetical protein
MVVAVAVNGSTSAVNDGGSIGSVVVVAVSSSGKVQSG